MGTVGILNVGTGDTKIVFDADNPQDMIRATRIVKDMLRRGYALLVDTGKKGADGKPVLTRAYDFDESKCEYIIADLDPIAQEPTNEPSAAPSDGAGSAQSRSPKHAPRKRVPASSVDVTAVARSAGG
jgi:hypothetical protein